MHMTTYSRKIVSLLGWSVLMGYKNKILPSWCLSESPLFAWRRVGSLAIPKMHCEDSGRTVAAQADLSSLGAHVIL